MQHVAASDPVGHFTTLSTVNQRRLEPCVHVWRVVCGNGGVISRVWRSRGVKQKMPVNQLALQPGNCDTSRTGRLFERRKHLTNQETG